MFETIVDIGSAFGIEDQVTAFTVGLVGLITAISGIASGLVIVIEKIAKVTPIKADNSVVRGLKKVIAILEKILNKIAMNPDRDKDKEKDK